MGLKFSENEDGKEARVKLAATAFNAAL